MTRPSAGRTSKTARRAVRPAIEGLEDRLLLYSDLGAQWTKPVLVTYSIVPDGTSVGGTPSNLGSTLGTQFSSSAWQQAIQKAAAVWEAVAHINLAQVSDDGSPLGTAGDQQGDPRFGDIRIAGVAQSGSQLAFAFAPPPFNGGTNAGDIVFNTAQSWQINGNTYDLETVAIHEFGHALGLGHSAISAADQYGNYTNSKESPTSDDVAGLQSIYGPPGNDPYETQGGGSNNNSAAYATPVDPYLNSVGQASLANAIISTASDVDWYTVTAPANTTSTMVVRAQAAGLSSFNPAVYVYKGAPGNLTLVAQATAPNSFGGTATANVSGVTAGATYYIKVMGANAGYAGEGTYGLQVNFSSSKQAPIAPPVTTTAAQPDQNPTTSAEGTGWSNNGSYTPYGGPLNITLLGINVGALLGTVVGLVGTVVTAVDNTLFKVTLGTLTGYGDTMEARAVPVNSHGHGHGPSAHSHHHGGVPSKVVTLTAHDQVLAAWSHRP